MFKKGIAIGCLCMAAGTGALGCAVAPDSSSGEGLREFEVALGGEMWTDPETGTTYLLNANRRVVNGGEFFEYGTDPTLGEVRAGVNSGGLVSDSTGSVQVQVAVCDSGSYKTGKVSVGCSVDADYVMVGGGAEDVWTGVGALLVESRPQDSNDSGSGLTYLASSKDQYSVASHKLYAYAIGIRLRKTNGSWMSHNELKQYVRYRVQASPQDPHPSASCTVPTGYTLIGGGARASTAGAGQLLTGSYPQNSVAWYGSSKDHIQSSSGTVSVYCVGIDATIPGFGTLLVQRVSTQNWTLTGAGTSNGTLASGWVPTSYGGKAEWGANWGRMLYRMSPSDVSLTQFVTVSKDHIYADSGWTTAYAVQVKRQ